MTTVWVVICDEEEGDSAIDGIYTTKELADESAEAWNRYFSGHAWVEEWNVQDKHKEENDGRR